MTRTCLVLVVALLGMAGCNDSTEIAANGAPQAPERGPIDLASITLSEKEVAQVETLPEGEREAALAQKVCPILTDDDGQPIHLGDMGTPYKVMHDGKVAYLCCKGCEADFHKDPHAALARLGMDEE